MVYEFRQEGGAWVETQKFAAPEGQALDSFGRSIALDGERALIANKDNVVVEPPGGTVWVLGRPVVFADGFESGDTSGWSQTTQ